ncbi:helix-turn-helix transcriptional regulator [Streptococcus iniae]
MNRFKEVRKHRGLTRKDVAKLIGFSDGTMARYEAGEAITTDKVEILAQFYNVNPSWLVGWIDEYSQKQSTSTVVEKHICRIPPYWENDNEGRIIKWKESRKAF